MPDDALPDACPPWCRRTHQPGDHQEDRVHADEGRTLPAVVATGPLPTELRARATDLTVQRVRGPHDPRTWVRIQEAEGAGVQLVVDEATARALARALLDQAT